MAGLESDALRKNVNNEGNAPETISAMIEQSFVAAQE
jgi:hypothetical protein